MIIIGLIIPQSSSRTEREGRDSANLFAPLCANEYHKKLTVFVFFECQTAKRSVNDEQDANEESGHSG